MHDERVREAGMIRGERVNLRAIERDDAVCLFRWFNDPEVMRFWGLADATISFAETQRRIEEWLARESELGRPVAFIIESLEAEPLGLVVMSRVSQQHRSAEISLLIGEKAQWGQGLGTDALETMLDACFAQWGMHRVWLRSEAYNERAHRLYQRCGFTREAVLRQASYVDGEFHDVLIFSRLATDPPSGMAVERAEASP
ncbi:MAG: N-acetyltransferase [Thermomicrobiales bacterium]|nr:MAG: N-acetyltransferase [Thermomicrobiales bacterium]